MVASGWHRSIAVVAIQVAGVLICLPSSAFSLAGQSSRIEGIVRDEVTGEALAGARVEIIGTSHRARTDTTGAYHFDRVEPGRVTLRVAAEHYTAVLQDLMIEAASTVFFHPEIQPLAVALDRLVARATGANRGTGGSKDVVPGDGLSGKGTRTGEALTARVAGARVLFSGGAVGLSTQILLRGVKSMNLSGEPLYYLDGLPVSPPTAPSAQNRGGEPSILDLIDPSTIERVEVFSGAAANAAFGLGANNGVILIYTKR